MQVLFAGGVTQIGIYQGVEGPRVTVLFIGNTQDEDIINELDFRDYTIKLAYKEGDRVEVEWPASRTCEGGVKIGTVQSVEGSTVTVEYDEGTEAVHEMCAGWVLVKVQ